MDQKIREAAERVRTFTENIVKGGWTFSLGQAYDAGYAQNYDDAVALFSLDLDALCDAEAQPVAVKPLEWPDTIKQGHRNHSTGGLLTYTIAHYGGSEPDSGVVYRWAPPNGGWSEAFFFAYEHAITAAQADYEARIRSALSPVAKAEPVWHDAATAQPEVGHRFIAIFEDGSGAVLGFRHDSGYFDQDGDDFDVLKAGMLWAYTPPEVRLRAEDNGEVPLNLPDQPASPPVQQEGVTETVALSTDDALWLHERAAGEVCQRCGGFGITSVGDGKAARNIICPDCAARSALGATKP